MSSQRLKGQMKKKASLKDIALKVGVSTALVSYVLNNKKEGRISKAVAERIREVAREMDYRTNQIARSLKTRKTQTIGLIVADISNPFFSNLARFIEDEADKKGYTVIIGSSDEYQDKFRKLMDTFLDRQVDGLIIAAGAKMEKHLHYLVDNNIPFVLVDRYFPRLHTNYVALDNFGAAYKAVNYLLDKGRKHIGMVAYDTELHHLNERKRGYLTALKDKQLPILKGRLKEVALVHSELAIEKAVAALLAGKQPVDALLLSSSYIANSAVKLINSLSIKVPDELAIISFDESEALDLFYAPITYLKQPLCEMAKQATNILLDSIEKNNKITQVNMEAELIIRQSA